ncbi:MAG: hypothetical protein ACRDX8_12365 [Acidimicrobiales bacterium]
MQTDGNLVLYNGGSQALWASDTYSEPGNYAIMQTDGTFIVYSSGGQWRWQSGTNGYGGAHLAVQSDGNLVVYATNGAALWARVGLSPQTYAQQLFFHYGWSVSQQYRYLDDLWTHESNWRWYVCGGYSNGPYYPNCPYSTGPYGIPQGKPGSKMAYVSSAPVGGPDWVTDPLTQVQWGLNYIYGRYGTPETAWNDDVACGLCGYAPVDQPAHQGTAPLAGP